MIDSNVSFDFITERMLKLDERIIYAQRLIYNDSITGDYLVNKVVTADDKGKIRIYVKDLQEVNKYLRIGTVQNVKQKGKSKYGYYRSKDQKV